MSADSPAAPTTRVTYADLWRLADIERVNALALAAVYAADAAAETCGDVDRAFYLRRLGECRRREAQFLTIQRLMERIEQSDAIKAELKRMADAVKAQAEADIAGEADGETE